VHMHTVGVKTPDVVRHRVHGEPLSVDTVNRESPRFPGGFLCQFSGPTTNVELDPMYWPRVSGFWLM
jgi:hypothetical protein